MDSKIQDCIKQFVKESGKPWDTWVRIDNKNGTKQGFWDPFKYRPVRIHVVHKDPEDKNENEDTKMNTTIWLSQVRLIMCGHIDMYGNYCEQWECESTGAICVDPVDAIEEDEGWNCDASNSDGNSDSN
jgi:hypothetical protein